MTDNTDMHRPFAAGLNGEVWTLLEKGDGRTDDDDRRMIHTVHASLYHWLTAGTVIEEQRGEWLVSHVYATLGLGESALRHGKRCKALTDEFGDLMEDFDRAYACEGLARAYAVLGKTEEANRYKAEAHKLGDLIRDAEDRRIFDGDFHGGNGYTLTDRC